MAKNKRPGRDLSNIANRTRLQPVNRVRVSLTPIKTHTIPLLAEPLSDRRIFNPAKRIALPFALKREHSNIKAGPKFHQLQFATPKKVALCVRRKRRKEVIHATGKAGKRTRKPRYNHWSKVKC